MTTPTGRSPSARSRDAGFGVAIVAVVAVVVGVAAILAGLAAGPLWIFETLAATGVLVGLGVALGALDRPRTRRRGQAVASRRPPAGLDRQVRDQVASLDPVEHRRLELGDPWPTVVVGPTGVAVVTVARTADPATVAHLAAVVTAVRRAVGRAELEVAGLLVVPTDAVVAPTPDDLVQVITVAQLPDALSRGRLVTMPVVAAVFARVSASLAADLPVSPAA